VETKAREKFITVRVSPDERRLIRLLARAERRSVSEL